MTPLNSIITLAQELTLREATSALPDAPVVSGDDSPRRTARARLPRTRRAVAHALTRTAAKVSPA